MKFARFFLFLLAGCFAVTINAHADRIGEVSETQVAGQIARFFSFQDPAVRYAIIGSILLGVCCGLLGSFIVVRKLALMGDALSHAVLPGVALGFLWNMTKDPLAIFIGATIAGLVGSVTVGLITQTTRLKEDTALGIVLASFYAVGICMVTMMQRLPSGNKSGIDKFLFGQAAALSLDDIRLMLIVTVVVIGVITLLYKEFLASSFDSGFAQASGFHSKLLHHLLMLMLAFAVVIALQAVGVVLVSAMLITPAAAAYMLTDRMHRMLFLAAGFGAAAGITGAFFSFLGNNLPTGPLMVLAASLIFGVAFFFGPRHGVTVRWWMHRSRAKRIQRENTLKAIYQAMELESFNEEGIELEFLASRRNEPLEIATKQVEELKRYGLATMPTKTNKVYLTPEGLQSARAIVRNHRLWELYLTSAVDIPADHVHEDAEQIEHVLGEDLVRQLEKQLDFPEIDPHGSPIPSTREIHSASTGTAESQSTGYGRKTS